MASDPREEALCFPSLFFFFFCLLGAGIPMGAALYIKKLNYWLKIPFGETAIHIKPKYIREYV